MNRLLDKTTLLGVFLLIVGLIAGVFLVQQSQEYREKAGLDKGQLIVVCQKVPGDSVFWEEIEVSEAELGAHIDSGDLLGNCPTDFPIKAPTSDNTEATEVQEKVDEEVAKVSLDTQDNKEEETVIQFEANLTETPQPTPQLKSETTPTPAPEPIVTIINNDATLGFFLKIQGIDAKRPARLVSLSLDRSGSESHSYRNVRVSPNSEGVYFGEIGSIPSGVFDLSFKTDSHLRRTFRDIKIESGDNTWYFENNPLIAGDFNDDNVLDITDIALLIAEVDGDGVNANKDNVKYDVDVNARIDQNDLDLVLENYTSISVKGD